MTVHLDIQRAVESDRQPSDEDFTKWVALVFRHLDITEAELTIRIVSNEESQQLNLSYRGKDKPTNVLSFPFAAELPDGVEMDIPLLGDLVIAQQTVEQEASEQNKSIADHWAHLVVHGTLHLLGYDHIESTDAEAMEALERTILAASGISDPYA